MNRQTLSDATSLHDGAVPIYAMQEIANGTKASEREAEKTADFLLGRLSKTNLIVKLKALQIISFCIREGAPVFADIIREEQEEIRRYSDFSGPPDPVMGDERYRRIRVASQEVLVCLNDGNLPRRNDPPPQANSNTWGPPQGGQQPHGYGAPYSDNPNQSFGQSGGYGGAPPSNQPWGKPSSDSRPAPYSDHPSNAGPSYGGSQGYGGQSQQQNQNYGGGPGGYGQSQGNEHHNPGYGGGNGGNAYGNNQPHHQPHQPSGLSSWSSPAPSGPSYGAPKPAGSGMWSSSGYQKSAPPPSYGGGPSYSRDNRPTVLVGHSLNFPKPTSHGNSSLIGGVSGTSSTAYGGTPGFGGSSYGNSGSGFSGGSSGGFGSQSGGYGGNSNSNMGAGFGGATNRPTSFADQNLNRMLSAPGSLGFNGLHGDSATATKLGKAVEGLKKIGVEAKGRWDRRNMDKSIGASLADHDELTAGPAVMDRGYYQPSMQQGTGGRDTSGEYERGMIDNLCASVGLARAPPADALKRFVDLAQTLDAQTIGDILLDKLEDSVWQVRLKALHVVLALLESPGSAPYMEFFEENAGVFEELAGDAKPTVASKSTQVLRGLGMVDDSTPVSTAPKRPTARATAPAARAAHPPAGDVDFLGFEGLTIQQSQHQAAPPNIYGSPPPAPAAFAHQQAPPQPQVSLLDGFDSAPAPNYQQQHFQHQTLSPRQQAPPPQQPEYADLLPMSPPQQPHQAPSGQVPGINLGGDDRSKTLGNFGKDLFTIANSPRSTQQPGGDAGAGERSAFNFM